MVLVDLKIVNSNDQIFYGDTRTDIGLIVPNR